MSALARIIWVAARPPVPPYSGPTLKARSGIDACAAIAPVDVVVRVPRDRQHQTAQSFASAWGARDVTLHMLEPGVQQGALPALFARRFRTTAPLVAPPLDRQLEDLEWSATDRLVIFDDIVFAPLLERYGSNAILSPHDCISEMFRSHARARRPGAARLKLRAQGRAARRYERDYFHRALLAHVVTDRDRLLLERVNPRARYHVAPFAGEPVWDLSENHDPDVDVLLWVDLRVAASVTGTRRFLDAVAPDGRWAKLSIAMAGRVPQASAAGVLGHTRLARVDYSPHLEDPQGRPRRARIVVIPDVGGAGIKSRCLSVLASGQCLACLHEQMEGVREACDTGAVNAPTMEELVTAAEFTLASGTYHQIGMAGRKAYTRTFEATAIRREWTRMINRALAVRDRLQRERTRASVPSLSGRAR